MLQSPCMYLLHLFWTGVLKTVPELVLVVVFLHVNCELKIQNGDYENPEKCLKKHKTMITLEIMKMM